MVKRIMVIGLLAGATALLLVGGCGPSTDLSGTPIPNSLPDTRVTARPPDVLEAGFVVEFFWTGEDTDGQLAGFQWKMSDNGTDGISLQDTLTYDPATGDTLNPWIFTTSTDSTFLVTADLPDFPGDPEGYDRSYQTHSFWVRAVDEDGGVDPTPAYVSFNSTTLLPTVTVTGPLGVRGQREAQGMPPSVTFLFEGEDPDFETGIPTEVRYLWKRALLPSGDYADTRVEFEREIDFLIAFEDSGWSPWIPYDPDDDARRVTLPNQPANDAEGNIIRYLFAVQARDTAGAVSIDRGYGAQVANVYVTGGIAPALRVSERFLGEFTGSGSNLSASLDIAGGQELNFSWVADASNYAGEITSYRYGWDVNDVTDPNDPNDPGWAVAWGTGPNWKRAQPKTFLQGSHNFVVQCRDNSGTISRGIYQLQVIQIAERPNQRSLLLIDDWRDIGDQAEAREAVWDRRWNQHLQSVRGFTPSDIIDAQRESDRLKFATINGYKSVVWFTNASTLSFFHNQFSPVGLESPRFNWLEVYQGQVGNLLLTGPGAAFNSFERVSGSESWRFPIIFNISANPPSGFGVEERPDGTEFNRGTTRYPYSAWCVETVDYIRPNLTQIWEEAPGRRTRTKDCSGIYRARVAGEFKTEFGVVEGQVSDLVPNGDRKTFQPGYSFEVEEWYNRNVTSRSVSLVIRDCQIPMYRAEARADAQDPEPDPSTGQEGVYVISDLDLLNCGTDDGRNFNRENAPEGATASPITGATIGLASRVYSSDKQLVGSEDFLWGFNPMGFEDEQVGSALRWIIRNRWDIAVAGQ